MPIDIVELSTREPDVAHTILNDLYGGERPLRFSGDATDFACSMRLASAGGLGADQGGARASGVPGPVRFDGIRPVSLEARRQWRTLQGFVLREITATDSMLDSPLVEAHLPISVCDIAADAGVSARALQYGFTRHLGTTPREYLRRVRLDRAHDELRDAATTSGLTVGMVARRWGFANTGRFAVAYRHAYGVSPSQTLRAVA
jgi:AraC-like DNA-binding protein